MYLADEITPIWQASEDRLEAQGVEPPFWAFAWPGGAATARHILDTPGLVAGKSVLDIAAGCAVAAIAAALAGAARVQAADIDPMAQQAARANASLNEVEIDVIEGDLLAAKPPETDLILAGDVFYERAFTALIWPWLQAARANGTEVWIADPGRSYLPTEGLVPLARIEVPTSRELEDREARLTVIYRLAGG